MLDQDMELECIVCGEPLEIYGEATKFCSKECEQEAQEDEDIKNSIEEDYPEEEL